MASSFTNYTGENEQPSPSQAQHTIAALPPVADAVEKSAATTQTEQREQAATPTARTWYAAFKRVLPIYLATHVAFLILTYLSTLFLLDNFSPSVIHLHTLPPLVWNHWDTSQFTDIATKGYDRSWRTAFFPLFPLLEAGLTPFTRNPFIAGLIISNLAALCLFVVLYRLVQEDFDREHAYRTVLYLAVFPTALFLAAAYNESLFLCLTLLSFYCMRRSHWWLAGLFGFLAGLTRSAGLFLFIPFCYEYLRQHHFQLKAIRFDILSGLLIPAGLGTFALYCYLRFHDLFAFSHAQVIWHRHLSLPWQGFNDAYNVISRHGALSFDSIHNVIDLSAGIIMLLLIVLCFVGPWRFGNERRAYGLYAAAIYLFLILFPATGSFPLQSLSRLVLELFPAFIVLAAIGKKPQFNLYYLTVSGAMLAFMLLQFLMGRWVV